jgi:hypothetical protein
LATYGFPNLKVEFDLIGGTLTDMTAYTTSIGGVKINAPVQDVTPAGVTWTKQLFGGIFGADEITIEGVYDDTATTGPDVVYNVPGATRTLKVTYGASKSTSVETIITGYDRQPAKGQPTMYTVTLTPTGTVTEA